MKVEELYQEFEIFDETKFFEKKFNSLWRNIELVQDVFTKKEFERYFNCSTYLKYVIVKDNNQLHKKLIAANLCRNRWCEICNWRRRLKYQNILLKRIEKIKKENKVKYIFVTLTIKNSHFLNLKNDLNLILKAFNKLFKKLLRSNKTILGYVRSLEFTLQKNDIEFINLHIHTLILVAPGYFDTSKNYYINQKKWVELWQKYLGVDYTPIVDVRLVKKRARNKNLTLEEIIVAEVIKYILKGTDILRLQKEKRVDIFEVLYKNFKNVRNLSSGGVLTPRYFNQKEQKEEEDLINIKESEIKGEIVAELEYVLKDKDEGYILKNIKEVKNEK